MNRQKTEGIEWSQVKARVPSQLHQKSKIALAVRNKTRVELMSEARERAIAEAGVKEYKRNRSVAGWGR